MDAEESMIRSTVIITNQINNHLGRQATPDEVIAFLLIDSVVDKATYLRGLKERHDG